MKKTLAIAALALGLFAFGCDDDEDVLPTTDGPRADAADAGAEAGKADVTPDTTGGDVADGGADAGDGGIWAACVSPKNDVPALAFCTQYMGACGFSATGGTAGMERYVSLADCMTKYEASTATKKGCTAYHLCVASGGAAAAATHCPHPPQASLTPPVGPCAIP